MKTLFTRIKANSAALYHCGLTHLALFVVILIVAQFDHRQLLGINLWTKPGKFALSIAIYCLTWPLLLQYFPFERIKKRFVNYTVFAMTFEMLAIGTQAARGQLSHYNTAGIYNAILFSLMGIVIVSQTVFAIYIGCLFFKVKAGQLQPAMLWAIRLGILMTGFFAMEGGIMASHLAHTVGAPDDGPGIPIFNWSRPHGDLRIAHFAGLHALQIVPLFVLISGAKTARPAIVFSVIYFLLVSALFAVAMMGRAV